MTTLHTLLAPFSWRTPLGRSAWLGHSCAAAPALVLCLMGALISLGSLPAHSTDVILLLTLFLLLCSAAISNPLVMPLAFSLPFLDTLLPIAAWQRQLPDAVAAPLVLAFFLLAAALCLRLIALAARRRRDAGKPIPTLFAVSALLLGISVVWVVESPILYHSPLWEVVYPAPFLLMVTVQSVMLLQPTRNTPPAP